MTLRLRTLKAKLNFFFLANSLFILLIFYFFTDRIVTDVFEREVRDSLKLGGRSIAKSLVDRQDRLKLGAHLMLADYGFKQAYSSEDVETINSALVNLSRRVQANFVTLLNLDGTVFAGSSILDSQAELVLRNLVVKVDRGSEPAAWSATRAFGGKLYEIVFVPFLAPDLVKWTAVGFEIDAQLARSFKTISGTDLIFSLKEGTARRAFASSLEEGTTAQVMRELGIDGERRWIAAEGRRYYFADSETLDGATIVVLKDASLQMKLLERTELICMAIFAFLFFASAIFSNFIAGLVSRPIREITAKSIQLANGELNTDLTTDVGDESLRELSRSLQRMSVSLQTEIRKRIEALREANITRAEIKTIRGQLAEKAEKSQLLGKVISEAKEAQNIPAYFSNTFDRVLEEFGFDRISILGLLSSGFNLQPLMVRTKVGQDPALEKTRTTTTGLSIDDLRIPELRYIFHHWPAEWQSAMVSDSFVQYTSRAYDDTALAIPFRVKGQPRGFLHVIDNSRKNLTQDDIDLLCAILGVLAPLTDQLPPWLRTGEA